MGLQILLLICVSAAYLVLSQGILFDQWQHTSQQRGIIQWKLKILFLNVKEDITAKGNHSMEAENPVLNVKEDKLGPS
jgi:hypothetical protein